MLPEAGSTITLDPTKKDRFGLPKARIDVRYGENERKLFAAGAIATHSRSQRSGDSGRLTEPRTNHELGGCHGGNDPVNRSSMHSVSHTTFQIYS